MNMDYTNEESVVMNKSEMIEKLRDYLPERRMVHSMNVAKSAMELCDIYGGDREKAEIAGILHDVAKYVKFSDVESYCHKYGIELDDIEKTNTSLSHSILGMYIAKNEFGIDDEEILNAIRFHTTGRPAMSLLEKIIFIADVVEVGRDYPGVDVVRELAFGGELEEAIVHSIDGTISVVLSKKAVLHTRTVEARNYYVKLIKDREKGRDSVVF